MKKILSTLVMVLFGVTSAWATGGTTTIYAHAIYDSNNDSIYEPGGGTVQARGQVFKDGLFSASEQEENKGAIDTVSTTTGRGGDATLGSDKSYKVYADVISSWDGFYFSKWCEVDTFGAKSKATTTTWTSSAISATASGTKHMYAFFEPVKISSSGVKQHAYTYDVGGASDGEGGKEGLVYFRVNKQCKGLADFDSWYLEKYSDSYDPTGFELVGEPYHRDGTSYDTIYVRVKYTNQNKAAATRVYVALKAKGVSTQQIRKQMIYGYSDLKPVFTTNPADTVDFTPVTPLATGESKTITIQTIYDKIATQNATWKVTLLDPETKKAADANAKGFKLLTASTVKEPQVSFTALEGLNQADLTAWLVIQATYKDAKPANTTYKDTLILTGDAGKVITLNGAQATTRTISIEHSATETWQEESVDFLTTLSGIVVTPNGFPTGADENKIQTVWAEGDAEVKVRLSSTMSPGLHTPTVNFASSGVEADLNIEALVYLAQPQVSATADKLGNAVRLQWSKVLGATHYVVYGNEVVDEEVVRTSVDTIVVEDLAQVTYTYDATSNGKEILKIDTTYEFSVEAVYMPSQVANRMSEAVSATPTLLETITLNDLAELNLYTGTDLYKEKHATYGKAQYKEKYAIDLVPTFSATGEPLFGRLYVFGMTTSTTPATFEGKTGYTIAAPTTSAGSNAITPCYIFEPEGNAYKLKTTISNMNIKKKDATYFTITASGQKYYLTGFCPYATTGWGSDQSGAFHVSGGANATIDIYLHNLQLSARAHTDNGKISTTEATAGTSILTYEFGLSATTKYIDVTAAALAFQTTNTNTTTPFQPNVHLLGDNELEGGVGCVKAGALGTYQVAGMHSSGMHIVATAENQATTLSIDDKWITKTDGTTIRTNGMLDLAPAGDGRPSLDLGNAKSVVNFNGGQIFLKNSIPSSASYLSTFAIGYRRYEKDFKIVTAILYGLGNDQDGGTVNFNDGTINCDTLTDANMTKYGQYYYNKTTMKCPQNTTINGGSHNCDIVVCSGPSTTGGSPKNKWGETLVSTKVAVTNTPEAPYYLAEIDFATNPGQLKCVDEGDPYYGKTLNQYYAEKGESYSHESMKDTLGYVTLMVPVQFTDKEAIVETKTYNWAVCIPEVTASAQGVEKISVGGEETVLSDETNKTSYLLYGEIDTYIQDATGSYSIPEGFMGAGASIEMSGNFAENITNENAYQIEKAQYILKPLRGDEWMLFSPPFDVTNVYVIETYPESDLENIAKEQGLESALALQAQTNMDLFYYFCYYTDDGNGGASNNLWGLYNLWYRNDTYKGAGKKKLTHFTGRNYNANYYLQHSSGVWEWDAEKNNFKTDWQYLPADTVNDPYYQSDHTDYNVVMKKGEIYSMNFPYMYNGYRKEEGKWDYWTGKVVIFEGLGSQTIEGTNYHQTITSPTMTVPSGSAEIRANSTFASMEVSDMGEYYLNDQLFIPNTSGESTPVDATQGFVLLNKPIASPMPQRIKSIDLMSGDVTLDGGDGTATGTPTIAGNNKMLVYSIDGGVGVVPVVAQQVSVYNAAGQLVTSEYLTGETNIPLPAGIYLVCGEHEQFKVLVK